MRERPSLHLKGRPSRASFVLCPLTPRCIGAYAPPDDRHEGRRPARSPPGPPPAIVSSRGHTGAEV